MKNCQSNQRTGCLIGTRILICIAMLALVGCNPDAGTLYGAAWSASEEHAEHYLNYGQDINEVYTKFQGQTSLHAAAVGGHDEMTIFLLDRGANPDVPDEDGNTPLHLWSIGGHDSVVAVLLSRDADPTIRNRDGKTPRDLAGRYPRIINDLKAAGG